MATVGEQTDMGPSCPICLGEFNVPRQLPCAHSFCQSCLQSFITSKATEHEKIGYIECPVCRQTTGNFKQNKVSSDWASLFPVDTVLQSMLSSKSKVDRECDACKSEGISVTATGFCAECEEAMCDICLRSHRKQKMTKSHAILTNEELMSNPQHVMKWDEGLTCFEHDDEELKFYCNNHKVACCGICYFQSHKMCSNVTLLKEELPALLRETKPSEIIEELKKLETKLNYIIGIKETNMNDVECQVNGLADQLREMRKKINTSLDELEMKVMIEGRRIHKEIVIRLQEENNQCLSLIHAIRNSQLRCETVHKYGNDMQKVLTAQRIKSQLPLYHSQVREKKTDTLSLHMKLTPLLEYVLSFSSSDVGNLVTTTSSTLSLPAVRKPTNECLVEKVETFNVNITGYTPWFTGVAILPRDRMILVDYNNSQCILLNDSHQVINKYTLTDPYDICVIGDDEVAVNIIHQSKIQILSVSDDVISPVRTITTKYKCMGMTAAGVGEIVVLGNCGNDTFCCSLIKDGSETSFFNHNDSAFGSVNYIALNNSRTRVHVSVGKTNFLYCFNMEGNVQYTYSAGNLIRPFGLAVDRDDNIYIVGYCSHNIHQLSPEGCLIQIFSTGVPQHPWAINFDNNRDSFMITNYSECQKIHIYQLK